MLRTDTAALTSRAIDTVSLGDIPLAGIRVLFQHTCLLRCKLRLLSNCC